MCLGNVSFNSLYLCGPRTTYPISKNEQNKGLFHGLQTILDWDLDHWRRIKWNLSLASICFAKSALRLLRWSQSVHLNTLSPVSVISLTIFDCTMAENKTQWHSVTRLQLKLHSSKSFDHSYHSQGINNVVPYFLLIQVTKQTSIFQAICFVLNSCCWNKQTVDK